MAALHDILSHHPTYAAGGETSDDSDAGDALSSGLVAVAEELISAVQAGDAEGVADALEDAFELMEATPHEEGPHE